MSLSKYKKLGMMFCGISMVVLSACAQKAPKEEMPISVPEVSAPMDTATDSMASNPSPMVGNTEPEPAPIMDVAPTAPVMDEPASVSTKGSGGAGVKYYTVKKGDTVYSIAKKFGVSVSNLMKWNGVKSAKALKVGKKLKVRL